jgi:hypothetical protein
MLDLWWTKWHWGRFSSSTSVSPDNPHSTNCSIIIIRGWYNRPTVADVPSGLSLTPPRETKKKKFYKDWFRRSKVNRGIHRHTHAHTHTRTSHKCTLVFQNQGSKLKTILKSLVVRALESQFRIPPVSVFSFDITGNEMV